MSRLEELIHQLCPDGVEYKLLGEVCKLSRGKVYSKDYLQNNPGDYPVYSSQTANNGELGRINTYDCEGDFLTWTTDGAHAGTIFHRTGKFSITNVCGLIKIENPRISLRFLYYWLTIKAKEYVNQGMGNPKLMTNQIEVIPVPLPPLPLQEEIVRILDQLTETTLKYQSELEAELAARKKQYEEYRNQLLDLEGKEGVEMKTLEDASLKITDGSHSSPKSTTEGYYMPSVKDMTDTGFDFSKCKIISKFDFDILKRNGCCPQKNDVLIAKDGSMLRYVFSVKENMDIALLSSIAIIRPKDIIQPDFMAYYFKQAKIRDKVIREYGKGGGVPRIILKNFKKINIPIPPLSEQERIVNILDRMDKTHKELCQSIETEIKMRKQQYEYYRNQLLDFKKKED